MYETDNGNMQIIDLDTWSRRDKFLYFRSFDSAWINTTVEISVEKLYEYAKKNGHSFFLMTLYAVHKAIHTVPQFKQRFLSDGRIAYFDKLAAITTIMGKDNEFFDELMEYKDTFAEYADMAAEKIKNAKSVTFRPYDLQGRQDIFCTSCVPWFKWNALSMTRQHFQGGGFPLIDWDKMDGDYKVRFAIEFNHCFADGYHLGLLINKMQEMFGNPESL